MAGRLPRHLLALEMVAIFGLCVPSAVQAQDQAALELSPGQLSPFARYFRPGRDDVIVSPFYSPSRRQRGDFEAIDLLVMVHNPDWERSLRFMVDRARTRVAVQVLMPVDEHGTGPFRSWSRAHCIDLHSARLNTPWIRDYGPLQVSDGRTVTWLDFTYYPDRRLDDRLPQKLGGEFQVPVEREEPHVDGGGLVSNGAGLCAMTDTSLADANMHLASPSELQQFVAKLGCHGLAVLPSLPQEQTGHADVIVQFLARDLVAVADMSADGNRQDAELLDLAVGSLRRTARAIGQPLRIVRIPMHARGDVFYSYLNSLRVRDLLFVPDYRDVDRELQTEAHSRLARALPGVTIVPVRADSMVSLGGAIHCISVGLNVPSPSPQPLCAPRRSMLSRVAPRRSVRHAHRFRR